jgi:hypothetical protein
MATAPGPWTARPSPGSGHSKADLKRFGEETPPRQPVLAVRTDDLIEKEAVLQAGTKGVFIASPLRRLCGRLSSSGRSGSDP